MHNLVSMTVSGKGALTAIDSLKKTIRRVRCRNGRQMPVASLSLVDFLITVTFKEYEQNLDNLKNFYSVTMGLDSTGS